MQLYSNINKGYNYNNDDNNDDDDDNNNNNNNNNHYYWHYYYYTTTTIAIIIYTTINFADEFRNVSVTLSVSVTEVGMAGWAWSLHGKQA